MNKNKKIFEQFMQELGSLDQDFGKVVDYGGGAEKVQLDVLEGAVEQQVQAAEDKLGFALPSSFKSFLLNWNGAALYKGKYRPGYNIFDTHKIVDRNQIWLEQELLPEERCEHILLFAEWGDGDYFAFDTRRPDAAGEYPVLDGDHNFLPTDWQTIFDNFEEWLNRLVEAEGRMFW
jgi:hypothetical protein